MKNRIICLVLSLVLIVGLAGANGAYAWFFAGSGGGAGAGGTHWLTTGNVGYTLVGDFKEFTSDDADNPIIPIVPEDRLLADLSEDKVLADYENCKMYLSNTSSVDSELRIKVTYGYGKNGAIVVYDGAETSPLTVEFTNSDLWSYDSANGYFVFVADIVNPNPVIPAHDAAAENAESFVIPMFNSIRYSGENTESDMISGESLTVTVTIELRQSQYVDWEAFNVTTSDIEETV